jgi:lactoylglutathione lyase
MNRRLVFVAALSLFSVLTMRAYSQDFASTSIDFGVCVTDLEKSAKFYTEVIGMKEVPGFEVPADFAGEIGLTANKGLKVRVFVLGEGDKAAKLKLGYMEGTTPKKSDNEFLHSQTGFRYITLMVSDQTPVLDRIKKAGVKMVGKTPAEIPGSIASGMWITIVRDPDGNLIELVGPKK